MDLGGGMFGWSSASWWWAWPAVGVSSRDAEAESKRYRAVVIHCLGNYAMFACRLLTSEVEV